MFILNFIHHLKWEKNASPYSILAEDNKVNMDSTNASVLIVWIIGDSVPIRQQMASVQKDISFAYIWDE